MRKLHEGKRTPTSTARLDACIQGRTSLCTSPSMASTHDHDRAATLTRSLPFFDFFDFAPSHSQRGYPMRNDDPATRAGARRGRGGREAQLAARHSRRGSRPP